MQVVKVIVLVDLIEKKTLLKWLKKRINNWDFTRIMAFKRYGSKTDQNQSALLACIRMIPNISICDLSDTGSGCPDVMLGLSGRNILIEIKRPDCAPSRSKLNDKQEKWHGEWKGQVAVVRTLDDVLEVLGLT